MPTPTFLCPVCLFGTVMGLSILQILFQEDLKFNISRMSVSLIVVTVSIGAAVTYSMKADTLELLSVIPFPCHFYFPNVIHSYVCPLFSIFTAVTLLIRILYFLNFDFSAYPFIYSPHCIQNGCLKRPP